MKAILLIVARVLGVVALALIALFVVAWLYMMLPKFGRAPRGARLERIQASPNYRDGAFHNEVPTPMSVSGGSLVSNMWKFLTQVTEDARPTVDLPIVRTDLSSLSKGEDAMVWLGHSAYYLQLSGLSILVDPTLETASPVPLVNDPFGGADGYRAKDIPAVDYLIITHDHWDHLDYYTLDEIKDRVGHYIVPLGVGEHLERWGISPEDMTELDWWEEADLKGGLHLTALPARHFSGRGLQRNNTLWASYMLQAPSRTVYLGGDSGYGGHYARIGERFADVDLALLENGQYNEEWPYIHMMPDSLSRAVRDLGAKRVFTGHNSKYKLSRHAWYEPMVLASQMAEREGIDLLTPMIGQVVLLGDSTQTFSKWWQDYK